MKFWKHRKKIENTTLNAHKKNWEYKVKLRLDTKDVQNWRQESGESDFCQCDQLAGFQPCWWSKIALPQMFCSSCGRLLKATFQYCIFCGHTDKKRKFGKRISGCNRSTVSPTLDECLNKKTAERATHFKPSTSKGRGKNTKKPAQWDNELVQINVQLMEYTIKENLKGVRCVRVHLKVGKLWRSDEMANLSHHYKNEFRLRDDVMKYKQKCCNLSEGCATSLDSKNYRISRNCCSWFKSAFICKERRMRRNKLQTTLGYSVVKLIRFISIKIKLR